ncbi:hypothetical protein CIRMBP1197_00059 [Enterococcus cecorum]|nr:hypothetical protein CIRMBP1197_00059 [Enterococcus cecorum]
MSQIVKNNTSVIVTGSGEKKEYAFADALGKVQNLIMKSSNDVLLKIQPEDVRVIEAKEIEYTERFLFFFFPRVRHKFEVKMEVFVEISKINMDAVVFDKTKITEWSKESILGFK